VRLFQHPDFGQAILRAAEHFAARKLRPTVIEKDYYVTEALRIIAEREGDQAMAPTERRQIASFVGDFLRETDTTLGCDDEQPFEMLLLHFRRTFVEKLFAIHAKVEILKQTGEPLGSYARHYYDLYCLAERPEVLAMLKSDEYAVIKADYARISEAFYARDFIPPTGMNFQSSDALFPDQALEQVLARNYKEQSSLLCYGDAPGWQDIKGRLSQLRPLL
jgi:hypothetical protein